MNSIVVNGEHVQTASYKKSSKLIQIPNYDFNWQEITTELMQWVSFPKKYCTFRTKFLFTIKWVLLHQPLSDELQAVPFSQGIQIVLFKNNSSHFFFFFVVPKWQFKWRPICERSPCEITRMWRKDQKGQICISIPSI